MLHFSGSVTQSDYLIDVIYDSRALHVTPQLIIYMMY